MSNILKVNDLTKSFSIDDKVAFKVLDSLSFEVGKGDIFGIMGESGAGKSTLLNILGTLDKPDSGSVHIDDQSIVDLSEKEISSIRNEKIGFVFQNHHLLAEFNVLENVMMPLYMRSMYKSKKDVAISLLKKLGLENRIYYPITKLSGGEQQRVSVCRALVTSPDIVFCDEPTGNLDHKNTLLLFDYFKQIAEDMNITFIIVSHSELLKSYATSLIEIEDGKII